MEVSAILNKVNWHPEECALFATKPLDGGSEIVEHVHIGKAYADSVEDVANAMCEVWAIPVRSSTMVYEMIEGLVVVPTSGKEEFRRVGSFVIPMRKPTSDIDMAAWLSTPRKIIKII